MKVYSFSSKNQFKRNLRRIRRRCKKDILAGPMSELRYSKTLHYMIMYDLDMYNNPVTVFFNSYVKDEHEYYIIIFESFKIPSRHLSPSFALNVSDG